MASKPKRWEVIQSSRWPDPDAPGATPDVASGLLLGQ